MSSSGTACCHGFVDPLPAHPSVVLRDGAALFAFRGVAAPAGVRALYARIAATVDAGGIPLAWLESAGGRGGFFRGDLVAVGEADVRALAAGIVRRSGRPAPAGRVYATVVRVLLAHEIGHALQAKLGLQGRGPASEREADLTAGWIAEALGWSEMGDTIVLQAVGSAAPEALSTHPTAAARVHAYRAGRRLRRARGGTRLG